MSDRSEQRGEIHLGDILRALKELPWRNEQQAADIVRALGFTLKISTTEKPAKGIIDTTRYSRRQQVKRAEKREKPRISAPPQPKPPIDLPSTLLNTELTLLEGKVFPPAIKPDWLEHESRILESDSETRSPLPRTSLFPENTSRGILSAALATQRTGHEIDVWKLIEQSVNVRIPIDLPRLKSATLERGCQLLLNFSDNMVPFWDDLKSLAAQIGGVIGEQRVKVYEFTEAPAEARRWVPPSTLAPWQPVKGTPVVVATDFGVTNPATCASADSAWTSFIQRCESAGSPLLILVPWPRTAWPTNLGSHPELIHWNPHTTASMVHRVIGMGHEVAP